MTVFSASDLEMPSAIWKGEVSQLMPSLTDPSSKVIWIATRGSAVPVSAVAGVSGRTSDAGVRGGLEGVEQRDSRVDVGGLGVELEGGHARCEVLLGLLLLWRRRRSRRLSGGRDGGGRGRGGHGAVTESDERRAEVEGRPDESP